MARRFKKPKWCSLNYYELKESRAKQVTYKVKKGANNTPVAEVGIKTKRGRIVSRGELRIKKYLVEQGVKFTREKTFKSCVNPATKAPLRFDFYLPDYKTLIEFDGNQHKYRLKGITNKEFVEQQKRDRIKDRWCVDNGYKLIRIGSDDFDSIPKRLGELLNPPN